MPARDEILTRLRAILARPDLPFPPPAPPPLTRAERMTVTEAHGDARVLADRFAGELAKLFGSAEVVDSPAEARLALIARLLSWHEEEEAARKGVRIITGQERQVLGWSPAALPVEGVAAALRDMDFELVASPRLASQEAREAVRHIRYGLTGAEAAFASTGSILVASGPETGRAASLLPFRHVALIPFTRLYPTLEAWLAARRAEDLPGFVRGRAQLVLISGPSKSADIEMNLTLGVHGPKYVHAILFNDLK